VQLIPQIIINYRRHNATGLQPSMMMLWAWAGVPLGVYNIVQNFNIALRIQPQILTALSLITWIQCYYYESVCAAPPKRPSICLPGVPEMVNFTFSACHLPDCWRHGSNTSWPDCGIALCKIPWRPLATHADGCFIGSFAGCRRAATLLGHLDPSYRQRNLIHICSH